MQNDSRGNLRTTTTIFVEDTFFLEYHSIPAENRAETLHRILRDYFDSDQKALSFAENKMRMLNSAKKTRS